MLDRKQIEEINNKLDNLFECFQKDIKDINDIEDMKRAVNDLKLNLSSIIDQRAENLINKQSAYCKVIIEQIDKKLSDIVLKCDDFKKEINNEIREIKEELNTKIENHLKDEREEENKYKQVLYKTSIIIIIAIIIALLDKLFGLGLMEYIKQLKSSI